MDSTTYAKQYTRKTICHPPQHPGFTCWTGAWMMLDDSIIISFTQATGPLESRPQALKDTLDKLSWPPHGDTRYDMIGLDLKNVHLRSFDGGENWEEISADSFRSPMNGNTGECEGALNDGTVLQDVWGYYLPFNPELSQTGHL